MSDEHVHEFLPPSKAVPRVWLVWTGEYADASVVGIYSSQELAEAAGKLYAQENGISPKGERVYIKERNLDEHATMALAGIARWRIEVDLLSGELAWWIKIGPGTGEPPEASNYTDTQTSRVRLLVYCDAVTREQAIEVAQTQLASSRSATP